MGDSIIKNNRHTQKLKEKEQTEEDEYSFFFFLRCLEYVCVTLFKKNDFEINRWERRRGLGEREPLDWPSKHQNKKIKII
jgi:hypothetical protein